MVSMRRWSEGDTGTWEGLTRVVQCGLMNYLEWLDNIKNQVVDVDRGPRYEED